MGHLFSWNSAGIKILLYWLENNFFLVPDVVWLLSANWVRIDKLSNSQQPRERQIDKVENPAALARYNENYSI